MYSLREQILLFWTTPFYIIIIGIELLFTNFRWKKHTYTTRDTLNNIFLTLCNAAVDAAFKLTYLFILTQVFNHSSFTKDWTNAVAYWICLLISEDFTYYWLHRFDHEIRFFWAVHVTHHSSTHLNFSTGFRSSVFEPLYRFIYFIPLAWFGFKPLDILFMYSATQIWGTLVHTELCGKLGWFEYIFVTPSHHRVHHGSNPKYLDKNMGMFLIIWDKMFGTFQEELPENEYDKIHYGLTKNINQHSLFQLIFREWIQIYKDATAKGLSFSQRWNYVFGAPGYSHDGSRKTSEQLLQDENIQRGEINLNEAVVKTFSS